MRTSHVKRWAIMAAVAAVAVVCGCSKLTYDNWQTVQVGSASQDVVKATLGDPWKTVDNTWVYNDPDRGVTAMIKFKDDKVVGKEWSDGKRGLETVGEQPTEPGQSEEIHIKQIK